ncbi:MAG: hypothetical protein J0M12_04670 [Deltaproteobacteria bacterium]|nr:hypothetical protein [Deltaproteobacteria bacterium]
MSRLFRASLILLVLLSAAPRSAFSAPSDVAPVEVFVEEMGLQNIPMPGTPFVIKARLSNTKDTERRMRAFVVRDGRVSDVAPLKAYLDENDQPTYEIQMHSPLAELSYQLILYNPDGSFSSSPRVSLRRPCVPYIDLSKVKLEPKSQGEARLETLIKLSRGLEREVAGYDASLKILEDLSERLKQ